MDRSASTTNLNDHRERYERKHAQLRATLKDGDPLKTVLDGLGGLSEVELKLITDLRRLRADEAKPLEVPPVLLEHDLLTARQVSKLLGMTRADVMKHLDLSAWVPDRMGGTRDGLFPTSEVLRFLKRQRRAALERRAREVARMVTGDLDRSFSGFSESLVEARSFLPAETVAAELGMSRAAVERLMRDEGPDSLYAQRHSLRRGWCVTREELDAYKRKLAARQGGKAVAA